MQIGLFNVVMSFEQRGQKQPLGVRAKSTNLIPGHEPRICTWVQDRNQTIVMGGTDDTHSTNPARRWKKEIHKLTDWLTDWLTNWCVFQREAHCVH